MREPKQRDLEPLELRARSAIQKSETLIRQRASLVSNFEKNLRSEVYIAARSLTPFRRNDRYSMMNWGLQAAMQITNANKGNLQIFDPHSGILHIAAQYGFARDFLQYFDCVHTGEAACGHALQSRARVLVEDVTESTVFVGTTGLEVLLDAGVRSVLSTPLIGCSGGVVGILSTHWTLPHRPNPQTLAQLEVLTRTIANSLESLRCTQVQYP